MSSFLLHKGMYQIHRIGEGESLTAIAKSYVTAINVITANIDTSEFCLGEIFWRKGRGSRYVPCSGAGEFLKMLGELIKRHNALPKVGTESDGSFMFARCLSHRSPFMHPAAHLLIQLNRGLTPNEIISEEGWSIGLYKRLRVSLHRIGEPIQRAPMTQKLVLSDELLAAARVAEELLPYHIELYAEAQKLPKPAK